ncbi:MAG: hypothetical protein ACM3QS_10085 [Bacteroidota bacterium]
MKKILLLAVVTFAVLSSGCQLSGGKGAPQTPRPASTGRPPAALPDTATPTKASPDADAWIAFTRDENIWLIHPDGSGLKQITQYPAANQASFRRLGSLSWSPDGKRLAFSYGHKPIFEIDAFDPATSQTSILLSETGGDFDWAPSGGELLYNTPVTPAFPASMRGLWIFDLEKRTKRQVFHVEENQSDLTGPRWSFDARYVIASSTSGDASDRTLLDLASASSLQLAAFLPPIDSCDWSPAELRLACITLAAKDDKKPGPAVTFVDMSGNILNDIALPDSWGSISMRWSPDGRRLAIGYDDANTGAGISLLSLGTESLQPLAEAGSAAWSPDGKWLLVWNETPGQQAASQISIVNADTGESHPLTEGAAPAWQPGRERVGPPVESVPTEALATDLFVTPLPEFFLNVKNTPKGDILLVHTPDEDYEMGPLARGSFAIGPNRKFFVYCTNGGIVYAARFGARTLTTIGNVRDMAIIRKGGTPRFTLQFFGDNPYTVQVTDQVMGEDRLFQIPRDITAEE